MKSTSLTVSIPLFCALSTIVYGAPVHRPSSGVRSHVGFQQEAEDQQISLQSSDFGSSDTFDLDAHGHLSSTSEDDDYYLSAETPLPSTRLMDMSYEKGQRHGGSESETIEQLSDATYPTPSKSRSHGTFYPPPETWTKFQRKTATSTRDQPLFSSPDPETTPYGFVEAFFPRAFDYDLELDTEALLIWAQTRPFWAWSIIGCLLVGLGILAVTIVEIAGLVWSALRGGTKHGRFLGRLRLEEREKLTDEMNERIPRETEKVVERLEVDNVRGTEKVPHIDVEES